MARGRPITGLDSQAPTARNARIILKQRLDDMYAYAPFIDNPDNMRELHDLRIATKRVRYTLELFEEFLPASSKDFALELSRLQDELGALHDSEVMLALLRQLLQPVQEETQTEQSEKQSGKKKTELLSPNLEHAILSPAHTSTLSSKERQGLSSFLRRQEQRREKSYTLFRQHWDELEQRHFRTHILEMVNNEW